jgi:hypothetical protein
LVEVRDVLVDTVINENGHKDSFVRSMKKYIGKVIEVTPRPDCEGWYHGKGFSWHKSWLKLPEEPKIFMGEFIGQQGEHKPGQLHFLSGMKPLVGKILPFKEHDSEKYVMINTPCYIVEKEWVKKINYVELPQTSLSSEEIEKLHQQFKFTGKLNGTKKNGVINWSATS